MDMTSQEEVMTAAFMASNMVMGRRAVDQWGLNHSNVTVERGEGAQTE